MASTVLHATVTTQHPVFHARYMVNIVAGAI